MLKLTRISFNSADWRHPTGEAKHSEGAETYNSLYGFGHEDWLFRSDWLIDGWRYAFIQGVNKSHPKLVAAGLPIDLTLFTKQPDKKRRYVATIRAVECLDDQQAEDALKEFKAQGWFKIMKKEIVDAGGDPSALGDATFAKHVLNVRFRLENVVRFSAGTYAVKTGAHAVHAGSTELPVAKSFHRSAVAQVHCTPEHARMQARLMQELKKEYPGARIVRERDFIDISVRTKTELMLFEIKSDLEPRTVIRLALGQILEYAFHPNRQHDLSPSLVIVGRHAPSIEDEHYLSRLRKEFRLPIKYRVVAI